MLTGYQGHEKLDETRSTWTLRGDVGVLARTVQLGVKIIRWDEGEAVDFELEGADEDVSGGGSFTLSDVDAGAHDEELGREVVAQEGVWARWLGWIFRRLFRARYGGGGSASQVPHSTEGTRLSLVWRMEAGGPMAPMINAMLAPAIAPAAEDLTQKIAAAVQHA